MSSNSHLELNVLRSQHGLALFFPLLALESPLKLSLASTQDFAIFLLHSKCSFVVECGFLSDAL